MARRPVNPMAAAEAVFGPAKKPAPPAPSTAALPNVRESVSIKLDSQVLEFFQKDGPGWQDRINEALRTIVRKSYDDVTGNRDG